MKKHAPRKLKLNVPHQKPTISDYLSASGTFRDGDLLLNKDGLKVISHDSPSSSAVTPPQDTTFTLEDLETVRVIGKGSEGVVQLVRHKWTGQFFALKAIQMNIQEDIRKQIVRELKIHQASQCPYVIVWYHSFFMNGVISIVLEYMDGGSLADVLRDFRRIPEAHLAAICKQVLKGLVYLHQERHVIHRDIKPSNLLLNHKGEVKISDFGVSVILSNSLAPRDTFVGTYIYMSPERISGGTYGFESDIWSLGLVILECAIGRFPYFPPGQEESWPSVFELVHTVVELPAPCASPDDFSPEFCSFISGCIQKAPKDRLSASQLLNHPFILKYESQGANANLLATFIQHWSPIA